MSTKKQTFKKTILITLSLAMSLIIAMALSSCITIKVNSLKGSGEVVTQEFEVSGFDKLSFSGMGKIIIEQTGQESLEVEAEKNIIDALNIDVSAKRLNIGLKKGFINIIPTKDIIFRLNVKDLSKIDLSGVGSIICEGFETESLSIDSSGLGNIQYALNAQTLEISISGAGKIVMSGEVDVQEIEVSGVGTYDAKELVSNDCVIDISGAGRALVNVAQTLDVSMSGVGNVEYKGNPSVKQNISGIGGTVKSID
ncbi:MAG: DUF2807 domain-containing protein [Actinobacteria bacterium]|nr:DUF2807 domain-containing protein [Actinomycetota bacterium]